MSQETTPPTPAPGALLTAAELVELLDGVAGRPYMCEAVDQRTHALQTAALALQARADDELVLAAALHDIGRAEPIRRRHPGLPHELAGGAFARDRLTERIAWVIEQHVPAKRYLVATDSAYRSQLSPTSITTLTHQGGPMTAEETEAFEQHEWFGDAVHLRRWDDQAKDPAQTGVRIRELVMAFDRWASAFQPRGLRPAPETDDRHAR